MLRRLNYDPEATIVATIGLLYIIQQLALDLLRPRCARRSRRRSTSASSFPWFGYSGYKLVVVAASAAAAARHLVLLDPHQDRPRDARHPVRPRDRAGLRHPGRPRLCRRVRARRHAGGGRRRADRADQPGALSDGPRPAAAVLHRRHHRRARHPARHPGRGRRSSASATASSRCSSRRRWPRSSRRCWWRWCWCSGRRACSATAAR